MTAAAPPVETTVQRAPLRVGAVDDPAEVEAEAVADRVLRMPSPGPRLIQRCPGGCPDEEAIRRQPLDDDDEDEMMLQRRPTGSEAVGVGSHLDRMIRSRRGGGAALPGRARRFFEPRFGVDLSSVRVHQDATAAALAASVRARAFTVGSDVFFGSGEWAPGTARGDRLLAHELTHTLQQRDPAPIGTVRRAIELRPPGPGEASAFDRAQELVNRLNAVSVRVPGLAAAVTYRLDTDGQTLLYQVADPAGLDTFDNQMIGFIDAAQTIPLRLITSAGLVPDDTGALGPAIVDRFQEGYLDVDDILAADDTAFKVIMVHFITERLAVRNYARRIGTFNQAEFDRAHAAGIAAEAVLLRGLLDDPSIRFTFEEIKPGGATAVRGFRSRDDGYRVFLIIRGLNRPVTTSVIQVQTADGRRLTFEAFLAERAAAVPAAAGGP